MYNHKVVEKKWHQYWSEHKTFKTGTDPNKKNYYALDMFPFPSAKGLHVGHPEGYTATDILARMKRAQGYNVLHPMGWDAFGLPTEQYAIKTGRDPMDVTKENIANFKNQLTQLGFSYDWDREVNTTDPNYYKWTQWIFIKLYEKGLAYVDEVAVNWCPALGTVLSNEEVIDGVSERGGHPVERRPMKQWVLKITDYAEKLLKDLDELDWPESLKSMQRNWIGKSEGAEVTFKVQGLEKHFTVFTTRPDTLFGATYCVLSPEHKLVKEITSENKKEEVANYLEEVKRKSDLERTDLNKNKTGVFTGAYAINPINGKKLPIWIADYVLITYGTGAIMAVPAHDERDYEFAKKYNLEIIEVLKGGNIEKEAYVEDGLHINSEFLNGLNKEEAIKKSIEFLEKESIGKRKTTYKLRDWLFSRQRYWGEPIPIITWEDGTMTAVDEKDLPLLLPITDDIKPSGTGESPLANLTDWINVVDKKTGKKGKRETNTMPQWAGSCWYYLRYIDPNNTEKFADYEKLKYWLPVDVYIGGAEHAVLHLLYARFWHKVLYDLGLVPTKEPFQKLFNQGMILAESKNGKPEKMSKSKGNVVNPDDIVKSHGADTLRVYEMFMGPLDASIAWSTNGLDGSRRFLDRIYRLLIDTETNKPNAKVVEKENNALETSYNLTVKKVTNDIENMQFNTAISQLMIFVNDCNKAEYIPKKYALGFIKLLAPFAPHISEEMWQIYGHDKTLSYEPWPTYDENKLINDTVEIVVQILGKVKEKMVLKKDLSKEELEEKVLSSEKVKKLINNKKIVKIIVVPNRLVNLVIK